MGFYDQESLRQIPGGTRLYFDAKRINLEAIPVLAGAQLADKV